MKIKIEVFGRVKNQKIDSLMDKLNKNYKDFGGDGKVVFSMPIHTINLEVAEDEWKNKKKEALEGIKEVYEEKFSDITFKTTEL